MSADCHSSWESCAHESKIAVCVSALRWLSNWENEMYQTLRVVMDWRHEESYEGHWVSDVTAHVYVPLYVYVIFYMFLSFTVHNRVVRGFLLKKQKWNNVEFGSSMIDGQVM